MKYLLVLLMFLVNCGFEKDMLPSVKEVDTKYKLVVTSPCSFHIQVNVSYS